MRESSIQPKNFGTRKVQKKRKQRELDKVSKGDPKENKTVFFFLIYLFILLKEVQTGTEGTLGASHIWR